MKIFNKWLLITSWLLQDVIFLILNFCFALRQKKKHLLNGLIFIILNQNNLESNKKITPTYEIIIDHYSILIKTLP